MTGRGEPFAGCCWPGCVTVPRLREFFCDEHKDQVPVRIARALKGAVWEGSEEHWRQALARLREYVVTQRL